MSFASLRGRSLTGFALLLVVDQASKAFALTRLHAPGDTIPLPGPVDLTLVMNRSNAFGMVPFVAGVTPWLLAAVNIAVALALVRLIWRGQRPLTSAAFAVIAAGALGNGVDRLRFASVVDFIDASELAFRWVFNLADASIDIGIAMILIGALREAMANRAGGKDLPPPALE